MYIIKKIFVISLCLLLVACSAVDVSKEDKFENSDNAYEFDRRNIQEQITEENADIEISESENENSIVLTETEEDYIYTNNSGEIIAKFNKNDHFAYPFENGLGRIDFWNPEKSLGFKPEINTQRHYMADNYVFGLINETGEFVLEPKYISVYPNPSGNSVYPERYKDDLMVLKRVDEKNGFGIINDKGEFILEPIYDYISIEYDLVINLKDGFDVINDKGEFILKVLYDYVSIEDNLLLIQLKDGFGLINNKGEFILEPIYEYIRREHNFLLAGLDGKVAFFTKEGEQITDYIYEWIGSFTYTDLQGNIYEQPLVPIKQNGKYGFIDQEWDVVIEPIYIFESIGSFDENGYLRAYPIDRTGFDLDYLNSEHFEKYISGEYDLYDPPENILSNYVLIDTQGNIKEQNNELKYRYFTFNNQGDVENHYDKSYIIVDENNNIENRPTEILTFSSFATIKNMTYEIDGQGYEKRIIVFDNAEQDESGKWYLTYEYPPIEVYEFSEE